MKLHHTLIGLVAAAALANSAQALAGDSFPSHAEPRTSVKDSAAPARGAVGVRVAANQASAPSAAHGGAHWSYTGDTGPENWGSLKADYHVCRDGRMQSPIDITDGFGGQGEPIVFDYRLTLLDVVNNGHTIRVNYAPGSGITVAGKRYELLQFHFHTPSEHAVNGQRAPMEVHFVHRSADNELAVVGVLLESGHPGLPLREIWSRLPARSGPAQRFDDVTINAADLLPRDRRYHRYMGSLTTPPCSEGVNWYVMVEPTGIDSGQVTQFNRLVGDNARPLQPLNSRLLLSPTTGN